MVTREIAMEFPCNFGVTELMYLFKCTDVSLDTNWPGTPKNFQNPK